AWRVMTGVLTVGDLVAFQTLAESFTGPIGQFIALSSTTNAVRADLQRVEDALKNPIDPLVAAEHQRTTTEPITLMRGEVELVNISFGYSPLEPPLLDGINLKLAPG